MGPNPWIYEINTWVWLDSLARGEGRPVRLGDVPEQQWDAIASWGFDAVWLMGVWERSPAGVRIAREHQALQREYRDALPDFRPEDVVGSPYAVHRYVADAHLGGPAGLKSAREALARRNMALLLDFVPNHTAIDHPWTAQHPEYFIHDDAGGIANGRDPYFPPWTDTAQLNIFNAGARAALIGAMEDVAGQCDGVRCDMAMLLLNDVFRKTWGERAGPAPQAEFWAEAIPAVKGRSPGFTFIAEVYWDLETSLQQLGFDYCYDKPLYDALTHGNAQAVRGVLAGAGNKRVRFIENHDETRAAAAFPDERQEQAAAIVMSTVPGAKLFYEGQLEGRRVKTPVQLGREREETPNAALRDFYCRLFHARRDPILRRGEWAMLETTGWPDNQSCVNLLAWSWRDSGERAIAVVNYAASPSQGRVHFPGNDLAGRAWNLKSMMDAEMFTRDGGEMAAPGSLRRSPGLGRISVEVCLRSYRYVTHTGELQARFRSICVTRT